MPGALQQRRVAGQVRRRGRAVPFVRLDPRDVHVGQPPAEAIEQAPPLLERRVDRPGVGHVKAKARLGQRGEDALKLIGGAAVALAAVHVLEDHPACDRLQGREVGRRVGVKDDPAEALQAGQGGKLAGRLAPLLGARRAVGVGGDVLGRPVQGAACDLLQLAGGSRGEIAGRARKLGARERRELDLARGELAGRAHLGLPVPAQIRFPAGRQAAAVRGVDVAVKLGRSHCGEGRSSRAGGRNACRRFTCGLSAPARH